MSYQVSYLHATTVLAVRHGRNVAIGADGQATLGSTIAKGKVKKIYKLQEGKIAVGFAGSTADAFALLEHFERKLGENGGNMERAAIELTKMWRIDRYLRKLEAMIIAVNGEKTLLISGTGDVLEPDDDVVAIGSGGAYAQSAALALKKHAPQLTAKQMVERGLGIAADLCIYTNHHFTIEVLTSI